MENSRILIIDDDRELCILIKKSVENEGIEADFCGTGREGMEMLECREYHLIILDVMMPGMDGFETLKKPFHMDELLARIFSLIRRYTRFNRDRNSQEILQYEGLCVNIDERSVKTGNGTFELPPKEFDVLMFLAENQGKILTKQRIYEAVWKEPYVYDDNNIMAVISRLRKKLEENPANPRYIQTIKGIGYRFNREV